MEANLSNVPPISSREIPRAPKKRRDPDPRRAFALAPDEHGPKEEEVEGSSPAGEREHEHLPVAEREAGEAGSHLDLLG